MEKQRQLRRFGVQAVKSDWRRFSSSNYVPTSSSHGSGEKENSLKPCGVKTPSYVTGRSPTEGGRSFWYKVPNRGWKSSRNGHGASQGRSRDVLGKPKSMEEAPTKFKRRRIAKYAKQMLREETPTTLNAGATEDV
ncbi:hypothetical protein B9Z55_011585 [Caenorhabditis nigoni]|uniref:Uncharacterized protein n=1 Tax=Caenorhabditis nigoni TaxID=1611254 RepID=A0A2G5UL01_9PELO|nr:hypothetical protein B9Z55_011585 [Caenorhabditis nigoni]